MTLFTITIAYFWVYYKVPIIVVILIAKGILTVHLKVTGYDKWWLALIPFGHLYCKRELCGLPLYLIIPYVLITWIFSTSLNLIVFILQVALCVVHNYKYAYMCIDSCKPIVYSLVPFAKYYFMLKEVKEYAEFLSR